MIRRATEVILCIKDLKNAMNKMDEIYEKRRVKQER